MIEVVELERAGEAFVHEDSLQVLKLWILTGLQVFKVGLHWLLQPFFQVRSQELVDAQSKNQDFGKVRCLRVGEQGDWFV